MCLAHLPPVEQVKQDEQVVPACSDKKMEAVDKPTRARLVADPGLESPGFVARLVPVEGHLGAEYFPPETRRTAMMPALSHFSPAQALLLAAG